MIPYQESRLAYVSAHRKYKNVEELRNLVISSQNGIQVRLRDIADVQDAQKTIEKIARVDQRSSVSRSNSLQNSSEHKIFP